MVEGVLFSERVEMRLPMPVVQSQERSQQTQRIWTGLVVAKSIEHGGRDLAARSAKQSRRGIVDMTDLMFWS